MVKTNMFENSNCLVTGGTGLVGIPLVNLLLERGANVTVVSLDDISRCPKGANFVKADLTHLSTCLDVCSQASYVFHCAGTKGSTLMCAKKPASFMVPMLQFNTNMLEAARRCNVKWFLYTSSVGVYHPAELLREDDVWTTSPSKHDWYAGWTKRIGEMQIEAYKIEHGWDRCSIVRPANTTGPYDNFDPANAMVVSSLIHRAMDGENPLIVFGTGENIRDIIFSKDVARGMLFAVENKITEPINLGSGVGYSIKEIAELIVKNLPLEVKPEIVWDSSMPSGDKKRVMSMKRANRYGFKPTITLEEGIKDTINWYVENKSEVGKRYNVFSS